MNQPEPRTGVSCTLAELGRGDSGVVVRVDFDAGLAERLMELGFVPGTRVRVAGAAPGGDPRVYRVDGVEIALRRETAERLIVSPDCPLLEGE